MKRLSLFLFLLLFLSCGQKLKNQLKEAYFYEKLEDNYVLCKLCPRDCRIVESGIGFCKVRKNISGKLYSLVYGQPCSLSLEPIEKAPFYHFIPSSIRLALATVGCNLYCKHCQNWQISQASPHKVPSNQYFWPKDIVNLAKKYEVKSICFTFTEPTICYEYMLDVFKLAQKEGLYTCIVSNGYINPKPFLELLKYTTAVKVDLKAFSDDFYKNQCHGKLEPVLKTIKIVKEQKRHLEIVNLIIPTLNDNEKEISKMCDWIKENVGTDIPLHFTRFFPAFKTAHLPPTPIETLEKAHKIAKQKGLKYVYIGNVWGHFAENTYCPGCKNLLIKRQGYDTKVVGLKGNKCKNCELGIYGIWE